jgi:hypothetical protein
MFGTAHLKERRDAILSVLGAKKPGLKPGFQLTQD